MNEFDEIMTEESEIETYNGGKDYSTYVGVGAIAGATILGYEGVKQGYKRLVKPGVAKVKAWWHNKHSAKPEAPAAVEEVEPVDIDSAVK